jgi:hypothetical protein
MNPLDESSQEGAQGLSRRQLLRRVGGSIAGATVLSLGLDTGRHAEAQVGTISLRDLLGRISLQGCDPGRGVRLLVPGNPPVISIRELARLYANKHNQCMPLFLSASFEQPIVGRVFRVRFSGENFTPGGLADVQFVNLSGSIGRSFSVRAQPDGTFVDVRNLTCGGALETDFNVNAIDVATGRNATAGFASYVCPPPPPSGGGGTTPTPTAPVITSVTQSGNMFTVKGTGFLANHAVHIRVVSNAAGAPPSGLFWNSSSDASGGINFGINLPCLPGIQLYFSANDERPNSQDLTGTLWSNTYPRTCA